MLITKIYTTDEIEKAANELRLGELISVQMRQMSRQSRECIWQREDLLTIL